VEFVGYFSSLLSFEVWVNLQDAQSETSPELELLSNLAVPAATGADLYVGPSAQRSHVAASFTHPAVAAAATGQWSDVTGSCVRNGGWPNPCAGQPTWPAPDNSLGWSSKRCERPLCLK
jgi:hypothetical protein